MPDSKKKKVYQGKCLDIVDLKKKDKNGDARLGIVLEGQAQIFYYSESWSAAKIGDILQISGEEVEYNGKEYFNVGRITVCNSAYEAELLRKETAVLNAKKEFQEETGIQLF